MTDRDHKTTLGERIFSIRTTCLENREVFASSMGVSKNTLVYYEKDERVPGADFLNNIVRYYPRVNPTWLLTGEGSMTRGEAEYPLAEGLKNGDTSGALTEPFDPNKKRADRSPIKAAAVSYIDAMTDIEVAEVTTFIVAKLGQHDVKYDWPENFDFIDRLSPEGQKKVWEILEARKTTTHDDKVQDADLKQTGT